MIDIGANMQNPVFDADRDDVLRRAGAAGVDVVVLTGTSVASSRDGAAFANAWASKSEPGLPRLVATAGVHPHDARSVQDGWDLDLAALAANAMVVAIGEAGLDYYRGFSPRAEQRTVFRRQIELAVETAMPLFVHDRDSAGETREILADYRGDLAACVIHCFTGTAAELDGFLDDGYCIGVTGWICDERRGHELAGLVPRIPADRLMIETDAPYLLPRNLPRNLPPKMAPKPRSRRNEPAFLPWIADRVARCRGEAPSVVERQTHVNAERFFGLS